jgi:hypothetical protein
MSAYIVIHRHAANAGTPPEPPSSNAGQPFGLLLSLTLAA